MSNERKNRQRTALDEHSLDHPDLARVADRWHSRTCHGKPSEVHLQVDGVKLALRTCTECDLRVWHREGEAIGLANVLSDLTDAHAKTRYRPSEPRRSATAIGRI